MRKLSWWQSAVFYQIYPRSFADGNGDGIGDFAGMIDRLDYLRDLGIDAIWLSPHYPSPLFDCGYDVADYTGVAPEYGNLQDFQQFLDAAHARDMRVILDMVLNHTADQHPWFLASRSARNDPRRDWYIWRDGVNGGPPNNWLSTFGGPAWEYDAATDQYYYHFFFKEQPDLNWRNSEVKEAMWQAVRFWLDRGVDGFRLDAIGTIFEDPDLTPNSSDATEADMVRAMSSATGDRQRAQMIQARERLVRHQINQPGLHELMRELRALVDQYPDRVLVGETEELDYCGDGENELHMVFNFPLMRTSRITPARVRANQSARLSELPPAGWPCNTLGNHDNSRAISHFGDGDPKNDAGWARISIALMLTLRGTPFLYYGEEIGMTDLLLDDVRDFRDMLGVWYYRSLIDLLGYRPEDALERARRFTRDKSRTPMQWNPGAGAGFMLARPARPGGGEGDRGEATTWLPVHPNHADGVNVANQVGNPGSLLNFYRRLLKLRRATPALVAGEYEPLGQVDPSDKCLAFLRSTEDQTCLVALNLGPEPVTLDLSRSPLPAVHRPVRRLFAEAGEAGGDAAAWANHDDQGDHKDRPWILRPFEVYIGEVDSRL